MAATRILILQGHPDRTVAHLGHALAQRYKAGAEAAGSEVRTVTIADLDFPLVRSKAEWDADTLPAALAPVQKDILWADHVVLVFPLWLGDMPAVVKGFLEQIARPGFAIGKAGSDRAGKALLGNRSARIVVTMGMPAALYRWYFGAHSVRSLERNILRFVGFGPVRRSLVGLVEGMGAGRRERWLTAFEALGRRGA